MANARKLQLLEAQQTGVARKVLNAVPYDEFHSGQAILSEIYRLTHSRVDLHTVEGCLSDLAKQGLVREFPKGCYRRILPNPPKETEPAADVAAELPPKVITPPPTPVEATDWISRLAGLANSLRRSADAIDDIALAVQDEIEEAKGSNAKLKQLQAVLAGVGS